MLSTPISCQHTHYIVVLIGVNADYHMLQVLLLDISFMYVLSVFHILITTAKH